MNNNQENFEINFNTNTNNDEFDNVANYEIDWWFKGPNDRMICIR